MGPHLVSRGKDGVVARSISKKLDRQLVSIQPIKTTNVSIPPVRYASLDNALKIFRIGVGCNCASPAAQSSWSTADVLLVGRSGTPHATINVGLALDLADDRVIMLCCNK